MTEVTEVETEETPAPGVEALLSMLRLDPSENHTNLVNDWLVAAGYEKAKIEEPEDLAPSADGVAVTTGSVNTDGGVAATAAPAPVEAPGTVDVPQPVGPADAARVDHLAPPAV